MVATKHLTHAAERLIDRHIDSVGTLDLLLLVHEGRDRDWGAEELCAALRCPEAWVTEEIERLEAAGLLSEVADGRLQYRRRRPHGAAVDEIARVCRHDRASVNRRIFARRAGGIGRTA